MLSHWILATMKTVEKTMQYCRRQAELLISILEEAKEALELTRIGKDKRGINDEEIAATVGLSPSAFLFIHS